MGLLHKDLPDEGITIVRLLDPMTPKPPCEYGASNAPKCTGRSVSTLKVGSAMQYLIAYCLSCLTLMGHCTNGLGHDHHRRATGYTPGEFVHIRECLYFLVQIGDRYYCFLDAK